MKVECWLQCLNFAADSGSRTFRQATRIGFLIQTAYLRRLAIQFPKEQHSLTLTTMPRGSLKASPNRSFGVYSIQQYALISKQHQPSTTFARNTTSCVGNVGATCGTSRKLAAGVPAYNIQNGGPQLVLVSRSLCHHKPASLQHMSSLLGRWTRKLSTMS